MAKKLTVITGERLQFEMLWDRLGLQRSGRDPCCNISNILSVFEKHESYAGHIWKDSFTGRIWTTLFTKEPRQWSDESDVKLAALLQRDISLKRTTPELVNHCVRAYVSDNSRNLCKEWLTELKWDYVPRLEKLFEDAFDAPPSAYASQVGRCWFISMVARALGPGEKVDTMPVLEGKQGAQKSKALSIIGGPYYTECHTEVLSKDFYQVLEGRMLVEISELHAFSRSEIERVKGIISCAVDRYRPPYGRAVVDKPRTAVLAGTTNRTDWQRDETGGRRFWPIATGRIDVDQIARNREQYFAEAMHRYLHGEKWWDVPEQAAAEEQAARRPEDPWLDAIDRYVSMQDTPTSADIAAALSIPTERRSSQVYSRISTVMRDLGWIQHNNRKLGQRQRYWSKDRDSRDNRNSGTLLEQSDGTVPI